MNIILVLVILFSQNILAKGERTNPYELKGSFGEAVALVFNDESEKIYGDLKYDLNLDILCETIKEIASQSPKVIMFDIDLSSNLSAAKCLLGVSDDFKLNYVLTNDITEIFEKLTPEQNSRIVTSNPRIHSPHLPGERTETVNSWLKPETRVTELAPILFPLTVPSYFAMVVMGSHESELGSLNWNWVRYLRLLNFSERNITKVSYQEVLSSKKQKSFIDKYVFVGVDQDKYDSLSNKDGEVVNGVFLHVQFFAAYKTLQKLKPNIPPRTEIYFNNN